MTIQHDGDTLRASAIAELNAANANSFRDEARHAFGQQQRNIEIDLSQTMAVDSCGLGALAAMFSAVFRAVLRATPELNREPAALLTRVNQLLFDELSNVDMFITAQLTFVDVKARRLVCGQRRALSVAGGGQFRREKPVARRYAAGHRGRHGVRE